MEQTAPRSLVTGASGFLGTHLCEVLVQAGHEVVATAQPDDAGEDEPERAVFPSVVRGLGIPLAPIDLAGPGAAAALKRLLEGPEGSVAFVFHLGTLDDPGASFEELRVANVIGTQHLLQAASDAEVQRVVFVSGAGVYGEPQGDEGTAVVREDAAPAPGSDLLRTLVAAEQLVLTSPGDHVVLRPGGVYGPRDPGLAAGRWELPLTRLARWPLAAVPRNSGGHVPLVHARDVARAALHLAVRPDAAGGIYNVGDDSQLSAREVVRLVSALCGNAFVDLPALPQAPVRAALRTVGAAARHLPRLSRLLLLQDSPAPGAFVGQTAMLGALGRDVSLDTQRLKATGFELEYPEAPRGIRETIGWYKQEGWLP